MQHFSAHILYLKRKKKLKKPFSGELKSNFFPYCPELPKWPKQKNLCFKMWLIYQLYIELGIKPSYIFQILQNLIFLDKEEFCHLMILLIDNSVAKI